MDLKKVKCITEWPTLMNTKKVQLFLRFANFYRKFIEKYLKIATSLTEMIKKNQKFQW